MEIPSDFWILFIANLPVVTALFISLQRGWIVMGINHNKQVEDKDKDIVFREQLRQEALADRALLQRNDQEKTEALRELTDVVKQTLELNDRLVNEKLDQRWDGNDRRAETASRTRRGS